MTLYLYFDFRLKPCVITLFCVASFNLLLRQKRIKVSHEMLNNGLVIEIFIVLLILKIHSFWFGNKSRPDSLILNDKIKN